MKAPEVDRITDMSQLEEYIANKYNTLQSESLISWFIYLASRDRTTALTKYSKAIPAQSEWMTETSGCCWYPPHPHLN